MVKRKCCVPNCTNDENIYFRFPNPDSQNSKKIYQHWLKNIKNEDIMKLDIHEIYKYYRICRKHFTPESYSTKMQTLNFMSIPTLFLPTTEAFDSTYKSHLKNSSKNSKKSNRECPSTSQRPQKPSMPPAVLVHGGGGVLSECRMPKALAGVKKAATDGYKLFANGGSALDAVEAAVRVMEDDDNFNAGRGSALDLNGEVVMDASIMNGADLSAGAVCLVCDVANPITLARRVMKTPHVLLGGNGASKFAQKEGIPIVKQKDLVTEHSKKDLENFKLKKKNENIGCDTVGAVAIDGEGHAAAGTSTGGLTGKMVGRIGDSPIIGCGTYADDFVGCVSATGHGETIMKYNLAHSIIKDMEMGKGPAHATKYNIERMSSRLNNQAGVIVLSKNGDFGLYFNTPTMPWACVRNDELHFGAYPNEHNVEHI